VVLALGSNLGNRNANIRRALTELRAHGAVLATSRLYDTAPEYVTEQPRFLNAAVRFTTSLAPVELLRAVKHIESSMGRQLGGEWADVMGPEPLLRNGPRPIDIDLLFYSGPDQVEVVMDTELLSLPHPRIAERAFVLCPLADLDPSLRHPLSGLTVQQQLDALASTVAGRSQLDELLPVTPLRQHEGRAGEPPVFSWGVRSYIMGVVNMTPDSFSDGGTYGHGVDGENAAVLHGLAMAAAGVDVLDIGGYSTRPGFAPVSEQEEIDRVVGVVRRLRQACDADSEVAASIAAGSGVHSDVNEEASRVALSVDTFRPSVAAAALSEGADLINDVSGGMYDDGRMYEVVADHGVPLVLMDHGKDPRSLHTPHDVPAQSTIVDAVSGALSRMVHAAAAAGVPAWQLIVDPGLGFAKGSEQVRGPVV
jgi:2-amino-4-hydroxy-6-hydroxymethyldihydropteridine diphosphokinase